MLNHHLLLRFQFAVVSAGLRFCATLHVKCGNMDTNENIRKQSLKQSVSKNIK